MSATFAQSLNGLIRTTGLVAPSAAYTACWWQRIPAVLTGVQRQTMFAFLDSGYSQYVWLGGDASGVRLEVSDGVDVSASPYLTITEPGWYFLAYRRSAGGGTHDFYASGVVDGATTPVTHIGTVTRDISAYPLVELYLGTDTVVDNWRPGAVRLFREYASATIEGAYPPLITVGPNNGPREFPPTGLYAEYDSTVVPFTQTPHLSSPFETGLDGWTAIGPVVITPTRSFTYESGLVALAVPDAPSTTGPPGAASSTVMADATGPIVGISATVTLSHSWSGDVSLELTDPLGRTLFLFARMTGSNGETPVYSWGSPFGHGANFLNTTVSFANALESTRENADLYGWNHYPHAPAAGSAGGNMPSFPAYANPDNFPIDAPYVSGFPDFYNSAPEGIWTLTMRDWGHGDTGTLIAWSLTIEAADGEGSGGGGGGSGFGGVIGPLLWAEFTFPAVS